MIQFLSSGRFWMDNIYCDGTEDTLATCRFDGWGQSNCKGSEAAGVVCMHEEETTTPIPAIARPKLKIKDVHRQGMAIRLAGGRIPSEGRVEVKLGNSGEWNYIATKGRSSASLLDKVMQQQTSFVDTGVYCRGEN